MVQPKIGPELISQITRQTVPARSLGVWWLGQSTLVLKGADTVVYVDPYLAPSERRLTPPACRPEDVTNADVVLCTHDHRDHIDPDSLPGIASASPRARFVVPRPVVDRVADLIGGRDRIVAAVAGEPIDLGPLRIVPIPAKHEEFDLHPTLGHPYLGYVLRLGDVTVYNAGDTVPYEGMIETLRPHAIDLAFLPINGRDFFRTRAGTIGNMDYREAAELADAIGVHTVVPVHYGMFARNTVPPGHFVSYVAESYPHLQTHILGRFTPYVYQRP